MTKKLLPDIKKEFAEWYQEVIHLAELIDQSPVRGSMVIRPYGCALWEQMQRIIDDRIKKTGHHNAIFPLFIPESFLKKEADHVAGFAPELAVVTHAGGKELEEPLVVRPTSETIIHYMFARWIKSWRDLPLKINQWANVVRWEMRPRPFLRTTEFFWQEGHTAHATHQEALDEVLLILNEYVSFAEHVLAIPVITGRKSEQEKFPGAEVTYTFETLMQDGKALQMGTSHLLSQSFAHAFDMQFQDKEGTLSYPYLTSWGVTTRLVGATVMVHGDQKGLVLPPRIAPYQVVIIPIIRKGHQEDLIKSFVKSAFDILVKQGVRVIIDDEENSTPGAKFYHWELRGVPVRLEIGLREVEQHHVVVVDRLGLVKEAIDIDLLAPLIMSLFDRIHTAMYEKALQRLRSFWKQGQQLQDFGPLLEAEGGIYQTGFCLSAACEELLKPYKASTRCLVDSRQMAYCFGCGQPSMSDVLIAKSY